ncbi:MAG: hypothetical protein M3162_01895 [Thermoproteota archaeon]|nr:hypothetical protein [Thermoproteota archaeon]
MGINKKIGVVRLHLDEAANMILNEAYGIHYFIIYPDLATFRRFYSIYVQKQIKQQNKEITLIAPFYETTDSVRQTLSSCHPAIDISKYENQYKTLLIVDAYRHYFDEKQSMLNPVANPEEKEGGEQKGGGGKEGLSISEEEMVKHAKKRGMDGFSILVDTGPYPFKGKYKELVDYELVLPTEFGVEIKRICLYHKKDFDKFEEGQKHRLIEHHGMAIEIMD